METFIVVLEMSVSTACMSVWLRTGYFYLSNYKLSEVNEGLENIFSFSLPLFLVREWVANSRKLFNNKHIFIKRISLIRLPFKTEFWRNNCPSLKIDSIYEIV